MAKLITDQDTEVFGKVDKIASDLRSNVLKSTTFKPLETLSEWLSELTGSFMYLTNQYNRAKVARENNEINKYIESKMNSLSSGEKFSVSAGEKEARSAVNDFYEAEKVFEGYRDAADQGILTIKKLMEVQLLELQREIK